MKMPVSPSRETLSPLSAFCSFSSSLSFPVPQFPLRSGLEKAFRCVKPVKRGPLQTQGRDVRNVRSLSIEGGGREGRNGGGRQGRQKTRHGRGAKLWRFEGGVQVPRPLPRLGPQNVPSLRSRPVNHCSFKHHAVPQVPPPVLRPAQAPSCTF